MRPLLRLKADARRQVLAVVAGVAQEKLAGLGPLEVQVRVVLPSESDTAVQLDVLRRDVEIDVRGVRLDQRRDDWDLVGVLRDRGGRVLNGAAQRLDL